MWYSRSAVVGGDSSGLPADPGRERDAGRRVPPAVGAPDAQQLGVEHPPGPRRRRIAPHRRRWGGALGIEREPRGEPRRLPPGAPPVQHRRVRERPDQHRPQRVHGLPAAGDPRSLPRIDAHLHGGGGAHAAATPRADPVEAAFHRAVPGKVEHPAGGAHRVRRVRGDGDAVGSEAIVEHLGVRDDGADEGAEGGQRRAGQFHLATGFEGDRATGRQRAGRGSRVERGRCVRPERRAQHRGIQRGRGLGGVVHQPFELHSHQPGRAVLETDRGDVALGVVLGAQHLCRLALGRLVLGVSSPVMLRTLPPATDSFASIDGRPGRRGRRIIPPVDPAPLRCSVDPQDTH